MKLGSHVGMRGKEMLLGSAEEAASYGDNIFMFYTGAPQNTKRKDISELNIDPAWAYMKEHGIEELYVHAPYIINLANTVKPYIYELAVDFLGREIDRSAACKSPLIVLHPGSHVGAGEEAGIEQIINGLNEVLRADTSVLIALETMSGKGSELGCTFEQLAKIYDGVKYNEKLRVCFDTCHTFDSGYDVKNDFDGVIDKFDHILGKDQIAIFHINDSKNACGTHKDRHANIGFGEIGFSALSYVVHHPDFEEIPKILETPWIKDPDDPNKTYPPYKYEIQMLKDDKFDPDMEKKVIEEYA